MDIEVIEDCLQRAAELSTVWAVVREQDANAWIVVLGDESLLDMELDSNTRRLMMRTELGQISHADSRGLFNDLLLRCASAFELPRIGMSTDYRYELLASWTIDLQQPEALAMLLDDITTQAHAWRQIVARPVNLDAAASTPSSSIHPLALKA